MRRLAILFAGLLYSNGVSAQETPFTRGDSNQDGIIDLSDGVSILVYLFHLGVKLPCRDAADSNDTGGIDTSDAVYIFNFLFLSGPSLSQPFPECGADPTEDGLGCAETICGDPESDLPGAYRSFTSNVEAYVEGDIVVVRSDGVPNHPSPYFPINDPRYESPHPGMTVNPNHITEQNFVFRLPREPRTVKEPTDTGLGPIGVSVTGVALFNQYAAQFSPLDNEIRTFDVYNGHPAIRGLYHYHLEPVLITAASESALVGILLDGFPLYGPEEVDGNAPTELDDCNGHTHATPEYPDGIYHYHVTATEPYLCGCYNGTPGTHTN